MREISDDISDGFESLLAEILEKARGVFLRAKLVILELVDNQTGSVATPLTTTSSGDHFLRYQRSCKTFIDGHCREVA